MSKSQSITLLLLITLGVAVGTLIALYVASVFGKQQLDQATAKNPLLALLTGGGSSSA